MNALPQQGPAVAPGTAGGRRRRVHVTFYSDSHEIGGAEIGLARLVSNLSPEIEATVVGTDPAVITRIAGDRLHVTKVLLPEIRNKRHVAAIAAHARAIGRLRPDVLHVSLNRPWGSQWGVLAGLATPGVKVLAVEHSPRRSPKLKHRLYTRLSARFLDAHVTVGEAAARAVAELSGVPATRIRAIHNGIPDRTPELLPRPAAGPVIGTLARLDAIKGLDVLVRAMVELPGVTAVIVGDGDERQRLPALADSLGVSGRVMFTGWSDRARDHLTTFDLYVLPSRFEALSNSAVEAMLAGLPVVATDVGGVRDAVIHRETGLLVPSEEPAALAQAIRELLADPQRMQEMGRAGRSLALERFTPERMAREYEALYEELAQ